MPWTPSNFAQLEANVCAPLEVVLRRHAKVFVSAALLNCDDKEV